MRAKVFYAVQFCVEERHLETVKKVVHLFGVVVTHVMQEPDGAFRIFLEAVPADLWYTIKHELEVRGVEVM